MLSGKPLPVGRRVDEDMGGLAYVPGSEATASRRLAAVGDDGFDPFALEDKGYDVGKFYTKSTDGKGISETKYVKLPPSLIGEMGELVAQRVIPEYRTDGDFIRDAIVHRLKWIAEQRQDGKLNGRINRMVMLNETMRLMEDMEECQMVVTTHRDSFEKAVSVGDSYMLLVALDNAEHNINVLRPAYQEELRKSIEQYRREWKRMKEREREEER